MDNNGNLVKSVEQAQEESIQSRATREGELRMPLLALLSHSGELISPWWSQRRDYDLDRFWKQVDYVSGAFYTLVSKLSSVPFRVEPLDPSVARWRKLAEEYQVRLESESEFGKGWISLLSKALIDLYTSDNGMFFEVIGGGRKDGPIRGLPVGLAHLDSHRCTRTGSIEYPVIYEDPNGGMFKLHRSRALFRSQLPSARVEMLGVGFCWLSRCINVAQSMTDIQVYKQEKLGSRPKRALGITQGGLDPESVATALQMADSAIDNQGLRRFSKIPFIGDATMPEADLNLIDMASLPDGFDYEQDITLGMYTIALAGSVPPRWLWPATATGATKADAMYSHVAGITGGPGATLKMISQMIGAPENVPVMPSDVPRFLPPQLKLVFDFQDDEQDKTSAEISDTRSKTRETDIGDGVITVRVAREQMVKNGELTPDQFAELELDDGRLPNGLDVLTLFNSNDGQIEGMLSIDAIGDPLDVKANDTSVWIPAIDKQVRIVEGIAVNGTGVKLQKKARQAVVALQKLRDLYEQNEAPDTEPMNEESENVIESDNQTEDESEEVEGDASPFEDEEKNEEEVKSLDALRTSVRAAIRGLWNGSLDFFSFVDAMDSTLERNLTEAFNKGAASNGIAPDELSSDERGKLREFINSQLAFVISLANDIISGSQANGGMLAPLIARADLWANRYNEAESLGRVETGANLKYVWVLGKTEHCRTCLRMAGKVKRGYQWAASPIKPQASTLECGGYNCQCSLQPTDMPLSRGPLPRS